MPGSFRTVTALLKPQHPEKVKMIEQSPQEQELSSLDENKQSPDGKWSQQQNYKFTIFVNYYQNIFTSKHKRKVCKIFKIFAQFLQTRTPTQCRSHFQKMMAKHKSITKLKKYYKTLVGQSAYRKELNQFRRQWELDHHPLENQYPEIKETKQFAIQTDPQEQPPTLCPNCINPQPLPIPPSPTQYYPMNQMLYWSESPSLQQMLGGNYVVWLPSPSQQTLPS